MPTASFTRQSLPAKGVVNQSITQLFQGIGRFCRVGIFGPVIATAFLEQNAPGSQNDVGTLE
jgi:hypothetical protein